MILYNSMSGLRVGHKVQISAGHKCQSQLLEVSAQRLVRKCEDKRNIKNPKVVSGFGDTNQMKSKWCVVRSPYCLETCFTESNFPKLPLS